MDTMSRLPLSALAVAVVTALAVQGCQSHSASLMQQWRAECMNSPTYARTGGLAACVAKRQAAYEAESFSGVADM